MTARILARAIGLAAFVPVFVLGRTGRRSSVGMLAKLGLVFASVRNYRAFGTVSDPHQHLLLVQEILNLPPDLPGDVVECGCYNGASTATLSLACARTGRRLVVCDSFEGLPRPQPGEERDVLLDGSGYYEWREGEFRSEGGLEGVRRQVGRYGDLDACVFVPGIFERVLPDLCSEHIVMVFEDADLASSVRDCLRFLWPKLQPGCKFFCHEPWSVRVVALFYDHAWWKETLNASPPGFHGSGSGLPGLLRGTGIGYAAKVVAQGTRVIHDGSLR